MGLSTTDLGTGSGMPKTIAPGNHVLKVNSIHLEEFTFIDGAYHLMLNVETPPIDDFEGFMIDKDDESKGHYAGQIGRVKASQYAFADGETKSGIKIQRDRSIMIFLKNLAHTYGIDEWFIAQDNKFDTIEDFVKNFSENAPIKDKYLKWCVAGKEYMGKTGYTNYDMYLPKGEGTKYAYGDAQTGKVLEYNETKHLKKLEVTEKKEFGEEDDLSIPSKNAADFSLD
jgi:hypothetical protein